MGLAIAWGDRHSRWIAAGYALIVLRHFSVARNFGLIQSGFLSEYGLMLGSAMEMPLLFYGLNRRLNEQTETCYARACALAVTDPLTGLDLAPRRPLTQPGLDQPRAQWPAVCPGMVVELAKSAALARELARRLSSRALVLAARGRGGAWCVTRDTVSLGSGHSILRC